tara:strand:- start:161 stop:739 length:579 start_codon:yes stop_codon:yes gene_type:complete
MKILDLGCGKNKVIGSVGLDKVNLKSVDIVHDLLSFPYPIENESFDLIYLRHTIEHFSIENIDVILKECYRILKKGGEIQINVPHVFSIAAYTDLTHKSYYTFNSGKFWDKNNSMSYYSNINAIWTLKRIDCSINWFDWKGRILSHFDMLLSKIMEYRISIALNSKTKPSLADRIIKKYSFQMVEIRWTLQK